MDDLLALALALNKLGEGGLEMQRRSRTSKRSDAPQRDPTDARALGQFTFRTQTHSDNCKERFVALLRVLQVFRANMSQAPGSYPGCKARQGKARQGKARQDTDGKTRKARQGNGKLPPVQIPPPP